jgi:hypothetical protein
MKTKEKTPANHFKGVSIISVKRNNVSGDKDTKQFSNPTPQHVYNLLMQGGKYSVTDICKELNTPDPRSHIRFIRNAGVTVSDHWENSEHSRYKIYFIHPW